jgi:hypothetical protein
MLSLLLRAMPSLLLRAMPSLLLRVARVCCDSAPAVLRFAADTGCFGFGGRDPEVAARIPIAGSRVAPETDGSACADRGELGEVIFACQQTPDTVDQFAARPPPIVGAVTTFT